MILFSSLSRSTSCWVTNFSNSFYFLAKTDSLCFNSIAAPRTLVARHFYFPEMTRSDEYLIRSNTKKHFKIYGMKYSYVLGTIWYNCRQRSEFFQYIQFFVIYDHLWAFCKINYMKRYKITANKMFSNFGFLTILGYETPGLLKGIDFGHFVYQYHHCRGRWSWLGDVHFIWWLQVKIYWFPPPTIPKKSLNFPKIK